MIYREDYKINFFIFIFVKERILFIRFYYGNLG